MITKYTLSQTDYLKISGRNKLKQTYRTKITLGECIEIIYGSLKVRRAQN